MKSLMTAVLALCLLCLLSFAGAEETFAPQGDYRVFCEDGCYGVQTLGGETVIPARFDGIEPFHGDLCVVQNRYDERRSVRGLWRLSTGEELLPCEYAAFEIAGDMVLSGGVINPEGDGWHACALYDAVRRCWTVPEDRNTWVWAHSLLPDDDGQFFVMRVVGPGESFDDAGDTLIRSDGTPILSMEIFDFAATEASGGILAVTPWEEQAEWEWADGTRYYNTVTDAWLEGCWRFGWAFADGYAAVWGSDWKWYIIDETGEVVSPAYEWIANELDPIRYEGGLFTVRQSDGWYVIRMTPAGPENLLGPVECRYDPSYIGHGIFAFNTAEGTLVYSGRDDRSVLLGQDVSVSTFCGGSATLSRGGRSGFLLSDRTVIDPAWERCLDFIGDYGFVRIDGLWYPVDRGGEVDRTRSYPNVRLSEDGRTYLADGDEDGIMCLNPQLQPVSHMCGM